MGTIAMAGALVKEGLQTKEAEPIVIKTEVQSKLNDDTNLALTFTDPVVYDEFKGRP